MNRAGMIWSVSTLASGRGQALASTVTSGVMAASPRSRSRASARCPVTAAAATMAGDIRCVRLPGPCRPLKLRLVVEAQRSPGGTMSPFMPTHMEQPDSTHSSPASRKMRSSPSSSACRLTLLEPGDTSPGTAALRPRSTAAAARRSSMRLLVHEPMNTRSTRDVGQLHARRAGPYRRARRAPPAARAGIGDAVGVRHGRRSIGAACSGLVPQVTVGAISAASRTISRSNMRVVGRWRAPPVLDRPLEVVALRARRAGRAARRRSSRRARRAPAARRPRWRGCTASSAPPSRGRAPPSPHIRWRGPAPRRRRCAR